MIAIRCPASRAATAAAVIPPAQSAAKSFAIDRTTMASVARIIIWLYSISVAASLSCVPMARQSCSSRSSDSRSSFAWAENASDESPLLCDIT
ncbi:hypothetical protein ACFOY2_14750 [Nonomuraea purpurea]|uniref:Secreted protein n=1 Tax=Nonomuraea purpurea TaxID=1849276 RepID=A0ABV8G823_9ACTN